MAQGKESTRKIRFFKLSFKIKIKNNNEILYSLKDLPRIGHQMNNQPVKDQKIYTKEAFGEKFEFSEEYLMSQIDPKAVLKAIENRYGFK